MLNTKITVTIFFMFLLSACASNPLPPSGFLSDYDNFKNEEGFESNTKVYQLNSSMRKKIVSIDQLYIAPVAVMLANDSTHQQLTPDQFQPIQKNFETVLKQKLATIYTVVESEQESAATLRVAITNLRQEDASYSVRDAIPVKALFRAGQAAYLATTKQKLVLANAAIEMEIIDSNQQRLFAIISERESGETAIADTKDNLAAIDSLMGEWIDNYVKGIQAARQNPTIQQ